MTLAPTLALTLALSLTLPLTVTLTTLIPITDFHQAYILQHDFPSVYATLGLPATEVGDARASWRGEAIAASSVAAKLGGFVSRPGARSKRLLRDIRALAPPPLAEMLLTEERAGALLQAYLVDRYDPKNPVGFGTTCGESVSAAEAAAAVAAAERLTGEPAGSR